MNEHDLTKKEIYDQEKGQERKERERTASGKRTKRTLLWLVVFAVLGLSLWGLMRISTEPSTLSETETLNSTSLEGWQKGNEESEIILVEYSDFQCPACRSYFPIVKKLVEERGDDFQIVYKHFPLAQHQNAKVAAYAAEAAGNQGKFWEMHDMLFEHQDEWAEKRNAKDIFLSYAKKLELDIAKFETDRASSAVKTKVDSDYKSGLTNRVNSTPTFFLNGKKIQPRSYDEFSALIENIQ